MRTIRQASTTRFWPRLRRHLAGVAACALVASTAAVVAVVAASPAAALDNGLTPTPYLGWNTYYGLGTSFTEGQIKAEADAMKNDGLKSAGYNIIWLDEGWWNPGDSNPKRDAGGNIIVDSTQWPDGMAAVATYIHNDGLTAGIYTDAGPNGCPEGTFSGAGLGSYGHYQQDVNTFAAWGYDAIKLDFCGATDLGYAPQPLHEQFRNAILNNSSLRPMIYNIADGAVPDHNNTWSYGPATGNSWRTSADVGTEFNVIWDGTDNGGHSVLNSLDENSQHPGANGPGHWNDPDYLGVGINTLSATEQQSQFSMWCVEAAPLIVGGDLTTLTANQLAVLTNSEALAVDQDSLGSQAVKVAEDTAGLQVWSKRLSQSGTRAIALLNRTASTANITIRFADAGLTGPVAVRDLWAHSNLGSFTGSYTVSVPSHGTAFLKLSGGTENTTTAFDLAAGPAASPYAADTDYFGGSPYSTTQAIDTSAVPNPAPQSVYQNVRSSNGAFSYHIPNLTVGASYRVRLHFAEAYTSGIGSRLFNVNINNSPALTDFDVYHAAGDQEYKAITEQFTATATQGSITIDFLPSPNAQHYANPIINAIEIAQVADQAINAGGGDQTPFTADSNYSGGASYSNPTTPKISQAADPAPAAVYQSERSGSSTFSYTFSGLPGSSYKLRLHFAENYSSGVGARLFNVDVNGTRVLANYDVFAAAGNQESTAVIEEVPVAPSSGTITVNFVPGPYDHPYEGNPIINGIELLRTG